MVTVTVMVMMPWQASSLDEVQQGRFMMNWGFA
jgi:hypothetical protein